MALQIYVIRASLKKKHPKNQKQETMSIRAIIPWLGAILFVAICSPSFAQNQTLEGQLSGLAKDIVEFMSKDRLLKGQKVRLDRVSATGMPDANYDQFIEQTLAKMLKDIIDESSRLLVKVELSYKVSVSNTNKDKRVIQMQAKLLNRGREIQISELREANESPLPALTVEVNNTSDIRRILGVTGASPDTKDHSTRLDDVEDDFEEPKFKLIGSTQVSTSDNLSYSVEIRKRVGGKGTAKAVFPTKNRRGLFFAPVDINDTYEIVLFNYDQEADAVAKVDIDGLNVISAFCKDVDSQGKKIVRTGYFIPRATASGPGTHVIPGWFHTLKPGNDNVFEFVVNELGKGAASALNVRGKTGVVTVRFFDAYKPGEAVRARSFGETGKGKPRKQDYSLVDAVIGTEPASQVTVRYSRSPESN